MLKSRRPRPRTLSLDIQLMDLSAYQRGDLNSPRAVPESPDKKWHKLCATYLPVYSDDSIWRYSRSSKVGDLDQGWKLHVSATILSANEVLTSVAPYLKRRGVLFKAPRSLQELQKINSGLYYGYCQVGKFITVYPRSAEEAVRLARRLRYLTRNQSAPVVPFDSKFRAQGSVYYRYGSFKSFHIENPDGTRTPALRDRNGKLVPDLRYSDSAKPDWVVDPFASHSETTETSVESPLKSTFRVFQSLAQRGKGGVYKGFDFSTYPPKLCILKEGRHGGEVTWEGRDGHWLVRHEEEALTSLRAAGVDVPAVRSAFEVNGNYYLVTEFIEGETLQDFLSKKQRRLSLSRAMRYAVELSSLLAQIHAAGWAWRDLKPANIMVTKNDRLRPVDFEGACSIHKPDPMVWSTPLFMPSNGLIAPHEILPQSADLYSLGVVINFLLTGRLPENDDSVPMRRLRRGLPRKVCDLVEQLLDIKKWTRLDANAVFHLLSSITTR